MINKTLNNKLKRSSITQILKGIKQEDINMLRKVLEINVSASTHDSFFRVVNTSVKTTNGFVKIDVYNRNDDTYFITGRSIIGDFDTGSMSKEKYLDLMITIEESNK